MPRYAFSKPTADPKDGNVRRTRRGLQGIQNQLNAAPQVHVVKNGKLPASAKPNDFMIRRGAQGVSVALFDDRGRPIETPLGNANNVAALQSGSGAPTVDLFQDGQSGWYHDTTGSKYYFCLNDGGTLVNGPTLSTLPGTLTAAQHGTLSGANLHPFTALSGTITDAQHGNLAGGALHDDATGAASGFLSATLFTRLNGATNAATGSTLVLRTGTGGASFAALSCSSLAASGSITLNGTVTNNGSRVLDARQTGWSAPTGTASRATFDTATVTTSQLAQRVYALLQDLGATTGHGLIDA